MPIFSAGFLLGNILLQGFPDLPGWPTFLLAPLVLLTAAKKPVGLFVGAVIGGFLWTLFVAGAQKEDLLPKRLEGVELDALVRVVSIPQDKGRSVRFDARVEEDYGKELPQTIRLSFYPPASGGGYGLIRPGDVLAARLRLKRPHGYMNPGGFDYERYLFSRGIGASGYIRDFRLVSRVGEWSPRALRYRLYQRMKALATPHIGAIVALSLGERGLLKKESRNLLLATGTGHLFAISGLHITLVFGFVFFLFRFLWTKFLLELTLWPSLLAAMVPAFLAACIYAWLAGFTIPTQRALIMLGCVVGCALLRRRISLGGALPPAIVAILVHDPLSTLTASFWMSFIAVGLIALCIHLHPWPKKIVWIKMQITLALALLPAGLWFFGQGALIAPLANLVAIPLVSLLILPSILLALPLMLFDFGLVEYPIRFADFLLGLLWHGCEWITRFDFLQIRHRPPAWSYPFAVIGIVAILVASQWRHKLAAAVLLLPLSVNVDNGLPEGAFEVTFLDVGQGLSAFITTRKHTLLFDTGPAYGENFSAAEMVVVPYLRSRHIDRLDTLLISHGDNDHAGGMEIILDSFHPERSLGNAAVRKMNERVEICRRGQTWVWDKVLFEIIHPPLEGGYHLTGNDGSCVLKVTAPDHSLLLTADIEKSSEKLLLAHARENLGASVALVPHHGSLTSSSDAFVKAVLPRFAVVTSGYRNRFGLPKREVLERYLSVCARVFDTAKTGALTIRFVPGHQTEIRHLYRRDAKRFWHTPQRPYSSKRC